MAVYICQNNQIKHIFTYNPRVCVGGVIKKIVEGYTFINGTRVKLFGKWSFDHTETYYNNASNIELPFGTYRFVIRGGGGAGGTNGYAANTWGGTAGAGGKGDLRVINQTFNSTKYVSLVVGGGGKTKANGGNGGNGGTNGWSSGGGTTGGDSVNGCGGGGGYPSYVWWDGSLKYNANGGGGGGGGGAGSPTGRYSGGGGGGAGGGYYYVDANMNIVGLSGKDGAGGGRGAGYDPKAQNGIQGHTYIFPQVYSGAGGDGNEPNATMKVGGAMAAGSGASGGGGGNSKGNHGSARAGGGGGGAGGSPDAGGGTGGSGNVDGGWAYNVHSSPNDTYSENAAYGVNNNYGIGGGVNQNGSQGFVQIRKIS